jgi:hypothetical protein
MIRPLVSSEPILARARLCVIEARCHNRGMKRHRLCGWAALLVSAKLFASAWAQGGAIPPAAAPAPAAAAVPQAPCLFTPEDLTPILARAPAAGVALRDSRGNKACTYAMPTEDVRQVVVLIDERYTAERFKQRVELAGRIASSQPTMFGNIGDGAFYVAGVAGARRGLKYVEISGLRQAAARPITPDDAAKLLRLALERLPRF